MQLFRFELMLYCFSAAFLTKSLSMNDFSVKFEIWDTAGQERFHCIAPMYYRNSQAAIVVYDITDSVSGFTAQCRTRQTLCILQVITGLTGVSYISSNSF